MSQLKGALKSRRYAQVLTVLGCALWVGLLQLIREKFVARMWSHGRGWCIIVIYYQY